MQRESLEDFEYFWLLTHRLQEVKDRLGTAARNLDPAQRQRELAGRLVADFDDLRRSPDLLQATRAQVAREIVEAESDLPVLINTRPREGAVITYGPSPVELWGATVPGAEVKVNGQTVRMSSEGRFLKTQSLSPGRGVLRIVVTKGEYTRTFERDFTVLE
jgi:hypothetical protein